MVIIFWLLVHFLFSVQFIRKELKLNTKNCKYILIITSVGFKSLHLKHFCQAKFASLDKLRQLHKLSYVPNTRPKKLFEQQEAK